MPEHATAPRPVRVKLPRKDDTGHLIRGVGYVSECVCGWKSQRCSSMDYAMWQGREHLREHKPSGLPPVIPPPGTVPPPVSGEAA